MEVSVPGYLTLVMTSPVPVGLVLVEKGVNKLSSCWITPATTSHASIRVPASLLEARTSVSVDQDFLGETVRRLLEVLFPLRVVLLIPLVRMEVPALKATHLPVDLILVSHSTYVFVVVGLLVKDVQYQSIRPHS